MAITANKVKNMIEESNLSIMEIARLAGVCQTSVRTIKNGERVNGTTLAKVFNALNDPIKAGKNAKAYDINKIERMLSQKGFSNSQEFFRDSFGMSECYWNNIRQGRSRMSKAVEFGLSKYLGVSEEDLRCKDQDDKKMPDRTEEIGKEDYDRIFSTVMENNLMLRRIMKEFEIDL